MADSRDVIIVGGGIAGGALATLLARAGIDVLVLERQATYRDRVRGEFMAAWGVADARRNGLLDTLLGVDGSSVITRKVPYDEVHDPQEAVARAVDLTRTQAEAPGGLDLSHPATCSQLAGDAAAAGAEVVFGVSDVTIAVNGRVGVRYVADGRQVATTCRLIVGADGRASVVRQQLGRALHQAPARTYGAGLLVDGVASWPADTYTSGTEGDLLFFVFPRLGGVARLYLLHDAREARRFTGADGATRFLDAFRFSCLPGSEEISAARPIGPCAAYPMNDSWVDDPIAGDGAAVLIGDAAGYNDPVIGQGLSLAMRDACQLAELLAGVVREPPPRLRAGTGGTASTPALRREPGHRSPVHLRGGGRSPPASRLRPVPAGPGRTSTADRGDPRSRPGPRERLRDACGRAHPRRPRSRHPQGTAPGLATDDVLNVRSISSSDGGE